MKDFEEFLKSSESTNPQVHLNKENSISKEPTAFYKELITKALPYVSPFLLSIVTGPFTTASILLQVTNKGIGNGL